MNIHPTLDQGDYVRLSEAVVTAVHASFVEDQKRQIVGKIRVTQHEVKLRTEMAYEIFKICYIDRQWGLLRSLDKLPILLRRRLDNKDWDIKAADERTIWLPEDGK